MSASDPDILVGELAIGGLILVALWRVFVWIRNLPPTPDPWDAETEKQLHEPEAVEICHRCFTPHTSAGWFCKHCGAAIGPYNNLMPFVNIFSEGEVLRAGVSGKLRRSPLIVIGYSLIALSFNVFLVPIYLALLLRNLKRQKEMPPETIVPDSQSQN